MSGQAVVDPASAGTLFVTDLDFTLLRSDTTLSRRTVGVINGLIDDGVLFTYATARSYSSSRRVTAELDLRMPVITYGGTMTADPVSGAPSDVRSMAPDVVRAILDAAQDAALEPVVFAMEGGRDRIRWLPDRPSAGVRSFVERREGDVRLFPLASWDELDPATVFYVTVIAESEPLRELRAALAPVLDGSAHFLSRDGYTNEHWLEIHAASGTKALAARRLAADIGASRVVAFGDNMNDIPLFEVADEGCAVANAVPELRAIATRVIGSNDDDGVAVWLEERLRR